MKIKLNKGHSTIDLAIPDDRIIDLLIGKDVPAMDHETVYKIIDDGIKKHLPGQIKDKKIAVLLPCYNDKKAFRKTHSTFHEKSFLWL